MLVVSIVHLHQRFLAATIMWGEVLLTALLRAELEMDEALTAFTEALMSSSDEEFGAALTKGRLPTKHGILPALIPSS